MAYIKRFRKVFVWPVLTLIFILSVTVVSGAAGYAPDASYAAPPVVGTYSPLDYPPDPSVDIPWNSGVSGVADIQSAFNNARSVENGQLGISLPALTLPNQFVWDGMSDGEKALWLINRERIDRGVDPLHGLETNVTGVAQYYAQYLLDNDAWGHEEDGNSPWERLDNNPAIDACHDSLNVAENLAVFVTSGSSIALPIERSVYNWMYDDSGSAWGHRHAILWYPYNDNSGVSGQEGFLGIGRANGGPYQGPFSQPYNFAEMVVMNVFDPCADWDYDPVLAPIVSSITPFSGANTGVVHITNLAGSNFSTTGTTVVELRKSGETSIPATNVTGVSDSQITCDFDLTGKATGSWDVVVINPDGQSDTLPGGFSVTSGENPPDQFVYLPLVMKAVSLPSAYTISGNIVDENGLAMAGVALSAGAGHTAMTDAGGNYTLNGLSAGMYTLTPSKAGYTFSPGSRSVSLPPHATAQNFVGNSAPAERLVLFEAFLRET